MNENLEIELAAGRGRGGAPRTCRGPHVQRRNPVDGERFSFYHAKGRVVAALRRFDGVGREQERQAAGGCD